jgi:phosphohistidine phosphatase
MAAERRLILIRHARSSYPHGVPDHDRPLSGKGRRNARAAGRWFVDEGPRIELALCSDATRARHTWEIVRAELAESGARVPTRWEPRLYGASPGEVVGLARAVEPAVGSVAVIGHEPTLSLLTQVLAGPDSDVDALAAVSRKFATNAVAVLRFTGDWAALDLATARLETFVRPRA